MESHPQNPEIRINAESFTHVYLVNTVFSLIDTKHLVNDLCT